MTGVGRVCHPAPLCASLPVPSAVQIVRRAGHVRDVFDLIQVGEREMQLYDRRINLVPIPPSQPVLRAVPNEC